MTTTGHVSPGLVTCNETNTLHYTYYLAVYYLLYIALYLYYLSILPVLPVYITCITWLYYLYYLAVLPVLPVLPGYITLVYRCVPDSPCLCNYINTPPHVPPASYLTPPYLYIPVYTCTYLYTYLGYLCGTPRWSTHHTSTHRWDSGRPCTPPHLIYTCDIPGCVRY